ICLLTLYACQIVASSYQKPLGANNGAVAAAEGKQANQHQNLKQSMSNGGVRLVLPLHHLPDKTKNSNGELL
ncbi:TPA: hypothetical protein ACGO43_002318, partial [Streptococcus suis]